MLSHRIKWGDMGKSLACGKTGGEDEHGGSNEGLSAGLCDQSIAQYHMASKDWIFTEFW